MHCTGPGCNYTGEYLLRHRDETLKCPRCKEGELVRNGVQCFNIGSGNRKDSIDISVSSQNVCLPAYAISPSGLHEGVAIGELISVRRNRTSSKN